MKTNELLFANVEDKLRYSKIISYNNKLKDELYFNIINIPELNYPSSNLEIINYTEMVSELVATKLEYSITNGLINEYNPRISSILKVTSDFLEIYAPINKFDLPVFINCIKSLNKSGKFLLFIKNDNYIKLNYEITSNKFKYQLYITNLDYLIV